MRSVGVAAGLRRFSVALRPRCLGPVVSSVVPADGREAGLPGGGASEESAAKEPHSFLSCVLTDGLSS